MEAALEQAEREMLAALAASAEKKRNLEEAAEEEQQQEEQEESEIMSRPSNSLQEATEAVRQPSDKEMNLVLEVASAVLVLLYVLLVLVDWSIQANGLLTVGWAITYNYLNLVFVVAFVAEQAGKIWLFGRAYFRNALNALDAGLVGFSVVLLSFFCWDGCCWTGCCRCEAADETASLPVPLLWRLVSLIKLIPLARLIKRALRGTAGVPERFDLAILGAVNVYALAIFVDLAQLHPSPAWSAFFLVLDACFLTLFMLEQAPPPRLLHRLRLLLHRLRRLCHRLHRPRPPPPPPRLHLVRHLLHHRRLLRHHRRRHPEPHAVRAGAQAARMGRRLPPRPDQPLRRGRRRRLLPLDRRRLPRRLRPDDRRAQLG